ncbi:3180_t:CDS:10 [Scutellospora calospora]|uniref:3180_t:CDS:1 n=1 Tax=Scutellospora calospora TaxID=85575 RepID=A0ACA9K5M1_9GLOM|nr:3180_t:CDS:10 [Scutellospora calospora]
MGIILAKLWRKLTNKEDVKIVLVGLDNAGKTTVLYKLLLNEVVVTTPTIGSNDLGGQDSLRATWKTYYIKTKAVIMVIDSTDRDRLHISRAELHTMMEDEVYSQNYFYMKGALTAAQISEALNLTSLRDRQWHIQACCALTGEGQKPYFVNQATGITQWDPPPLNQPQYSPPSQPPPPNQQYYRRKKALLIGINYFNTKAELKGCINDVHNVKRFLIELYGFRETDMLILTDEQSDPTRVPVRGNIIAAMKWLVLDARPNDSGHGGQEMHDIMVRPLLPGVRLTAIFDSCHSGTALDLPYIYSTHGVVKEHSVIADGGSAIMSAGMSYLRGDINGIKTTLMSFGKKAMSGNKVAEKNKINKSSPADVIMFSGCKDSQTSADANEAGQNTGAMSYAFITALRANRYQTYQQLLNSIRDILSQKYTQKPQLSTSHEMDMNTLFIM